MKHVLRNNDNDNTYNDNDIDAVTIHIKIKYSGETIDRLIKQCMVKLYKCFKNGRRVKFNETTELSCFTKTKDKISLLSQSSIVYKIVCTGSSSSCNGKAKCTF